MAQVIARACKSLKHVKTYHENFLLYLLFGMPNSDYKVHVGTEPSDPSAAAESMDQSIRITCECRTSHVNVSHQRLPANVSRIETCDASKFKVVGLIAHVRSW